jgi:hypothetical protein
MKNLLSGLAGLRGLELANVATKNSGDQQLSKVNIWEFESSQLGWLLAPEQAFTPTAHMDEISCSARSA